MENMINELVMAGKNGVSNKQMIPVMKNAIDANDNEKIKLLNEKYPAVFASTFKYIGKDRQNKLEVMFGGTPSANSIQIPTYNDQPLIESGPKGVSNFQMIPVMKNAIDTNDIEKIELLNNLFPAVFASTFKYIGKDRQNKLESLMA